MNDNTKKLLELISENPDLPILPMVSGEVCGGDEYAYWVGSFSEVRIDEYLIDEWYGDGCVRFKSENDDATIIEGIAECKYGDCKNEENWRKAEAFFKTLWKKAIVVYIEPF